MISPKPSTSPPPKAINNDRFPGLLPVPYSYVFLNFIDFNRNVLIIVIILFLIYFMTCKVALHVAKKSVTCYLLFAISPH